MKTKYAVVQFYEDGSAFPVRLDCATEAEAIRGVNWQKTGAGSREDWRAVPTASLRPLLESGKVHLSIFTAEAQAEKRAQIMEPSA